MAQKLEMLGKPPGLIVYFVDLAVTLSKKHSVFDATFPSGGLGN